ncbi:MAG TPA: 4Fe-4S binding protein [Desulfosporosinus sp.]|nr:4Fe-4S binding protein [Desulfosporosinus sp.]
MKRNIVKIDEYKCNGCGLCVTACHEGALQLIDGKARLISESYCDGLGDCLPECPTGAIVLEKRETSEYDEEAVKKHMEKSNENLQSKLGQWPCQLKLVPLNACGGILQAVKKALSNSGKMIPWNVVTISTDGRILED